MLDLSERGGAIRDDLTERGEDWKESLTEKGEDARESLEEMRQKLNDLVTGGGRGIRRLLRAFPKLRPERYKEALEYWRRHMDGMK